MFPTKTLIYTAIAVGISTYLIVFNLNNLVLQCSKAYSSVRSHLVAQMKSSRNGSGFWSKKAKRFNAFKPQHEKAHPSEWWIAIFLVRTLVLWFFKCLSFRMGTGKDVEDECEVGAESLASGYSSAGIFEMPDFGTGKAAMDPAPAAAAADQSVPSDVLERQTEPSNPQAIRSTNGTPDVRTAPTHLDTKRMNAAYQQPIRQETRATALLPLMTPAVPRPEPEIVAGESELISESTTHLPPRHKKQNRARRTLSKIFRRKQTTQATLENDSV